MNPSELEKNQTPSDSKRHRRSKNELEGRIYVCDCGKSYLSQPALNNHKKTKHPDLNGGNGEKRGRGRPRKYLQNTPSDFESQKYNTFFKVEDRLKGTEVIDITEVINNVFDSIFFKFETKCYSHPKHYTENPVLNSLFNNEQLSGGTNKMADDIFYEYLVMAKAETNQQFFTLMVKFVLLFRECFNYSKNKININKEEHPEYSAKLNGEALPDLCNEFYTEFLDLNSFFGIDDEKSQNDIIEIIQHFCIWLYKNNFTKSKLSLA